MGKARRDNKNKIFKIAVIVLLVVFLLVGAFAGLKIWEEYNGKFVESDSGVQYFEHDGKKYTLKVNGIETFLVMGLDKYEGDVSADSYNNDQQADFLMLIVFDNNTKSYSTIHINRDSMVDVNILGVAGQKVDTITKQIALAHTYGNGKDVSCRNTADAVSNLLCGIKVDHYISLKMDAVAVFNDLVGGVEVEVLDDFAGVDDTLVKGQKITLNGEQALHYVQTRKGLEDSSNSTRMQRQRQYLNALHDKSVQLMNNDKEFVVTAVSKMSDYLVSDRSVTQLQEIAKKLSEYNFVEITDIKGENKMGERFIEFYPDEKSVKDVVVSLFYEQAE